MCKRGDIYPAPIKVGQEWRVLSNARLVHDTSPVRGGLVAQLEALGE